MKFAILLSIPALLLLYYTAKSFIRNARRRSLKNKPFPEACMEILKRNLPPYNYLPDNLKTKLHWYINIFLDEKTFEGCGGQEITDEIKVTIAGNACLLLLGHPNRMYPTLQTILVYPSTYLSGNQGLLDSQNEPRSIRLGESWQGGPVVLAWNSVIGGAVNFEDGENVTIHEFAHQLDQEDGYSDGAPIFDPKTSSYQTWAKVFNEEFKVLQKKKRKFRKSVMNKYGATNPAEFFAVSTESYFEQPKQLKKAHPELFEELNHYYGICPLSWYH